MHVRELGGLMVGGVVFRYGNGPYTTRVLLLAPTYTFPFAIVVGINLLPRPTLSRVAFMLLFHSSVERLLAEYACKIAELLAKYSCAQTMPLLVPLAETERFEPGKP